MSGRAAAWLFRLATNASRWDLYTIVTPRAICYLGGMAISLDTLITWRSAVVLGLGMAAEYALLALIEDGPFALKMAPMLCATGALAVVQAENWFKQQRRHLFTILIAVLAVIYAGFIAYAIQQVDYRRHIRSGLERLYSESAGFLIVKYQPPH